MGSRRGSRNSYLDKILRGILLEKMLHGQKPEESKGGSHTQKYTKHSGRGHSSTRTPCVHTSGVLGDRGRPAWQTQRKPGAEWQEMRSEKKCRVRSLSHLRTSASIQSDMGSYWRVLNRKVT